MRIKPKTNKLLIMSKNATSMTKFKLPRKQKKEFIKLYGRKQYNSIMIRVQLKYDQRINLKEAMKVLTKALKGLESKVITASKAIKKIGLYPDLLSDKIQDNLTIGNCEFQENNYGVLLNFKDAN